MEFCGCSKILLAVSLSGFPVIIPLLAVDEGECVHLVEDLSEGSVVADGLAFFSAWAFHGGGEKQRWKKMTSRKYNLSCPTSQLGFAAPRYSRLFGRIPCCVRQLLKHLTTNDSFESWPICSVQFSMWSNFSAHDLDDIEIFSGTSFHHGNIFLRVRVGRLQPLVPSLFAAVHFVTFHNLNTGFFFP